MYLFKYHKPIYCLFFVFNFLFIKTRIKEIKKRIEFYKNMKN